MSNENTEALQATAVQQQTEKLVPQHEVNALVAGVKQKAYEKGRQDKEAEFMQQNATAAQPAQQTMQNTASTSSDEKLRQIAVEELQKHQAAVEAQMEQQRRNAEGQRILNELNTKIAPAKAKIEDYDKVVAPDLSTFKDTPEVLYFANMFDNSGEMLHHLAQNPSQAANIALMARANLGQNAFLESKKLSDSIKVNEMAANQPKPKAPLSQVMPSTVGVGKTESDSYTSHFRGKY